METWAQISALPLAHCVWQVAGTLGVRLLWEGMDIMGCPEGTNDAGSVNPVLLLQEDFCKRPVAKSTGSHKSKARKSG